MIHKILTRLVLIFAVLCALPSGWAQVDGNVHSQDTLYIIEEEITYDTLYLYDTLPQPALMSKEELIKAFRSDRGIGRIYYQKGGMYLTGSEGLFRLEKADLQELFSASEYEEYRKAKHNQYISIPLYVAGSGAAVMAGIGLVQFCASFVQTAKYHEQLLDNDDLAVNIWRSAMGGVFLFGGGIMVATGFFAPAIVMSIKSKVRINNLVNEFNTPTTALQLKVGPTLTSVGLSLSF